MRFEEYRKHDAVSLAGLIAKREVSAEEVLETAIASGRTDRAVHLSTKQSGNVVTTSPDIGTACHSGARHTAQAATAEQRLIVMNPIIQAEALAAPPNQSTEIPTATGPRNPVVNPASA